VGDNKEDVSAEEAVQQSSPARHILRNTSAAADACQQRLARSRSINTERLADAFRLVTQASGYRLH
jgi:hypothetical protein